MKTIIAGGRDFTDFEVAKEIIDSCNNDLFEITEVVSGLARGADTQGSYWARFNGIPVIEFPANWKSKGKSAGPIRNRQMGDYADALIAFWDGKSRGTKNMIDYAYFKGLKVHIFNYSGNPIDAEGRPY